ncbi:unnamed protein product [Phaedon cochleariae]|uniref:Fibronectin type-III domain-containing protein n=1 Tax=Phaedon cochleariae TaxID=80249 RepID=A0A9N9SJV9_PHACE|nr:unnamed protein product [Phaedon cochleariae]
MYQGANVRKSVFHGKPFSVKNCSLSNQTSSSVEVFCLAGFDGGLPQHFILELYSSSSAVPRFNMTSFTEPYFFLDNLEPDITFRIIVFAVNIKGRSHGVVLEEVTFQLAQAVEMSDSAQDGELALSPILGVLIGATLTMIVVILLVIVRVRKSQNRPSTAALEHKGAVVGLPSHNNISSTKPLLRSISPRDMDERDPDVIPAKYGSPDGDSDGHMSSLNGPPTLPVRNLPHSAATIASPDYAPSNVVPEPKWISPVSAASVTAEQYHQYNNPVAMVAGTFPRESRPKDLRLGNGSSTLQRVSDLELNGVAIKERLMANRLPESCV